MFGSCFVKTFSVLQNKNNKENEENTFGFQLFFVLKNIENTKKIKLR